MSRGLAVDGFPSNEELKNAPGYPSEERFKRGPVAVIECVQEIPCNPCEIACPRKAIQVGVPITNLPGLDEEKCTGCGVCVARCPGLAIFVVDKTHSDAEAAVSFPYEYLPLPREGDVVPAVNRAGDVVCKGTVLRVSNPKKNDRTAVVTIAVPTEMADDVRGMVRIRGERVG
jgi:Predicted ATPase, RNase L inhibitor (RLI) homolog